MATSYTFTSGGKTYTATPNAKTTTAQKAAVANNPNYKPVTSGGGSVVTPTPIVVTSSVPVPYTIKSGDTLSQIAARNNTTIANLLANNPSITNPNLIKAGATLNLGGTVGGSTPTPITETTPASTPGILSNIPEQTQIDKDIASRESELLRIREELSAPETDEQARARLTDLFQKEIDALNTIYAQQKQQATQAGLANLGTNRASQARFGLLGSTFGEAETKNINQQTLDEQKKIDEQNAATIAPIYTKINQEVLAAQQAKKLARATSVEEYIKNLKETKTIKAGIASSAVRNLILNKANPTDKDFIDMATQIGIDPSTFKGEYMAAKRAEDEAIAKATLAGEEATLKNKLTESQINKNNRTEDSGLTGVELKNEINKQIATPEFKALTDEEKQDYIRSMGGTPYDFGF